MHNDKYSACVQFNVCGDEANDSNRKEEVQYKKKLPIMLALYQHNITTCYAQNYAHIGLMPTKRATILLVTPLWAAQAWFPTLIEELVDIPILIAKGVLIPAGR